MGYRWLVSTTNPDDTISGTYTCHNVIHLLRILWGIRRRGEQVLYIEWRA